MQGKKEKKIFGSAQRVVLDAFTGEGEDSHIRYEIVDYRRKSAPWKNMRSIEFFNNGRYIYSTVYLSERRHFQPLYPMAQKTVDEYYKLSPPKTALVLGCAGCSIPRFLVLHYKDCIVTGIEYSKQFESIARRYFISSSMTSRFRLIRGDAFRFVPDAVGKQQYDYIHTDIYTGDAIHPMVFSQDYVQSVYSILSQGGLAMFNAFRVPAEKLDSVIDSVKAPFGGLYVLDMYRKYFVAMVKTSDAAKLRDFEEHLPKDVEIRHKKIQTDFLP